MRSLRAAGVSVVAAITLAGCQSPTPRPADTPATPTVLETFQGAVAGSVPMPAVPTPDTVDLSSLIPEDGKAVSAAQSQAGAGSSEQVQYVTPRPPVEALVEVVDKLKAQELGCDLQDHAVGETQTASGLCRSEGLEVTIEATRAAGTEETVVTVRVRTLDKD